MKHPALTSAFLGVATLLLSVFLYIDLASAEPWVANRFAENCAACHSPSRRNLEPKDRRCTLSCQGCHTNPNGGGMRNEYGVWNQQRWLRSFKSKTLASKGLPAPLPKQRYGRMPDKLNKKAQAHFSKMAKQGPPLVVVPGVDYELKDYDKRDRQEHITVASRAEFLARLTKEDPWRLERQKSVFASGDFRYFMFDGDVPSGASGKKELDSAGPMVFDLGVKVRPVREKVSMVFEGRFENNPNTAGRESLEWAFTGGTSPRSAYVLVDDLPYATYVQYGLYKPMFGHMTSDHSSLLNSLLYVDNSAPSSLSIQARSARTINKALSIGGSPNVPFANIHWIQPMDNKNYPMSGESGIAATLGGRFVTLGASIMLSYWSTKGLRSSTATNELKTDMLGLAGGLTYKDFIFNADFSRIEKEFSPGQSDAGSVSTLEVKYRFWREMYLMVNYATANVNRSLKEGSSGETMYGIKTFLTPGTEFELLMISRTDRNNIATVNTDLMQAQLHLFF